MSAEPVADLSPVGPGPLHGVRYQPRVPGARFADVVPGYEPGEALATVFVDGNGRPVCAAPARPHLAARTGPFVVPGGGTSSQ